MKPFGCPVRIFNTIDHLGKFDGKADEGFFVGDSTNSKAFKVFNSRTRIVEENLHVQFSKNTSNIAGSRPNWIFDIDALTNYMNYKPVVAGNQSNGNAGTKACDNTGKATVKIVPGKDYILLPLWTQDLSFSSSSKDSPYARFKPLREEEKKDAKDPGNESGNPTEGKDSEVPSTEEPRINQEKDDNINNTNNVNAVSSTVNVVVTEVNVVNLKKALNFQMIQICMNWKILFIQMMMKMLIKEEVYVCQLPGIEDPDFPDREYKVEKALYGLHQASRAWYETLSTYLLDNRFQRGKIDKILFIRRDKGDILLIQVYVDDIIFGSTKKSLCIEFEKMMHKKFQMSSMGELTFFLGLQVKQKEDGVFISQDKYVTEILKKFGFNDVKTASTPMETQKPLLKDEDGEEVDVHLYRSMIGSLMYLTYSRPDIMFEVYACARYQVNLKVSHLYTVKRIFRYLKGQPKLGLWYPKDSPFDLVAYTDSDYAGASLDRKSTTGVAFLTKSAESEGFEQIVDFLNASYIKYALTVNPTIYTSCIEQFWSIAKAKRVNGKVQLQALVDGKKIIITEATVRRDLRTVDANGVECHTHKSYNFEKITLMGNKNLGAKRKDTKAPQPSGPTTNVADEAFTEENRVIDLETTKTTQGSEIASLKRRVKKLEKKNKSRTHKLKRLYKIGRSSRVVSYEETSLGDQEDASKQERKINDIDADAEITLVDESQGRNDDDMMFDTGVFNDEEVFAGQDMAKKEVSTADPVTTVGEVVITANVEVSTASPTAAKITNVELTLAQTLAELKSARPKTKGVVMQEPSESTTTTTTIPSNDKGKGIMVEEPLKMEKKDQISFDEQEAIRLQAEFDKEIRLAKEKDEVNIALIEEWNDIQAKIKVGQLLAERLQAREQEELTIEERVKLFQQLLEKRRKFFAAKRAE
ncbi:putative ribonuclease H-like domain-containing protein [Tanacetum coccineum]